MIQQEINKIFSVSFALLFSFVLALPITAGAAELTLTSEIQEVGIDQQFQVDLVLNTENEEINAIEGRVIFPEDLLELKEIRDGNSVINFWIDRPRAITNKETNNNEIVFAGITPGGFNGQNGLIFSAVFQSMREGSGAIEVHDIKALLNDGEGTEAETRILNLEFRILKSESQIPDSRFQILPDADPPEEFIPQIAADPAIFDGKWFLVFATQDKKSGIAGYAIHESTRIRTRVDAKDWISAESPYLLRDQKLRSYIYVKAADKAGNERIAMILPKYPLKEHVDWWIWGMIVAGIIIGYILWRKIKLKIKSEK